jgi:hypothetical protein
VLEAGAEGGAPDGGAIVDASYSYQIGAAQKSGTLASPPSATSLGVVVGGVFPTETGTPWHVRYDDVAITTTP